MKLTPEHSELVGGAQPVAVHVGAQTPVMLLPVAERVFPHPSFCVKLTPKHSELGDGPQLGTQAHAGALHGLVVLGGVTPPQLAGLADVPNVVFRQLYVVVVVPLVPHSVALQALVLGTQL